MTDIPVAMVDRAAQAIKDHELNVFSGVAGHHGVRCGCGWAVQQDQRSWADAHAMGRDHWWRVALSAALEGCEIAYTYGWGFPDGSGISGFSEPPTLTATAVANGCAAFRQLSLVFPAEPIGDT
jgi:hypothetical protein